MAGQQDVDEFVRLAMVIIQMCMDYASANEWTEQADANIRRLITTVNVLLSAVQQASAVARPPASPPPIEPTAATAEAPAEEPKRKSK